MAYQYSSELLDDILFRGFEETDGTSDFEAPVLRYLNRAYRALWMGGTEFDPKLNEVWWWMQAEGSLIQQPVFKTGTVNITNNSASVSFSSAPSDSKAGWYLKINDHPDVFVISAHTAGNVAFTLDTVYTGDTNTAADYRLMKLDYDLASDCLEVIGPMNAYVRDESEINQMDLSVMSRRYPLNLTESGPPKHFAPVDENTVRFDRYGDEDGDLIRIDYDYLIKPADLTDSGTEEPLVPLQYRHVLADMALYFLHSDKGNEEADNAFTLASRGIKAMVNDNRARWIRTGKIGHIFPRQKKRTIGPLRTESGSIIAG